MKIVALMGKAGSGKDTLLHSIVEKYPNQYQEIISCTTRPPRQGEKNGVNYNFLSIDEFTDKLLNGDLLEATQFNDWFYGTSFSSLSDNKINIGVFNPEGVKCLLENTPIDMDVIYIKCPDKIRLIRQLNRETSPDVDEIIRRYGVDKMDFDNIENEIDCKVFNNQSKGDIQRFVEWFGQNY